MSAVIEIVSGSLSSVELRKALAEHVDCPDVHLDVEQRPAQYRGGWDAGVVVAAVSGGASALSALITGTLALLATRRISARGIVIRGKDGASVECPANASPEEIAKLVEFAQQLDRPVIELP